MEGTECEMSAPGAYDIDVTDTVTVVWKSFRSFLYVVIYLLWRNKKEKALVVE